jgi:hypothetical protein
MNTLATKFVAWPPEILFEVLPLYGSTALQLYGSTALRLYGNGWLIQIVQFGSPNVDTLWMWLWWITHGRPKGYMCQRNQSNPNRFES